MHLDVEEGDALHLSAEETTPPEQIEARVRAVLAPLPDVRGVAHVLVHYLDRNTLVEVQIQVDERLRIAEARVIVDRAKAVLEQLPGVDEAHVDLEINDAHHWHRLHGRNRGPPS